MRHQDHYLQAQVRAQHRHQALHHHCQHLAQQILIPGASWQLLRQPLLSWYFSWASTQQGLVVIRSVDRFDCRLVCSRYGHRCPNPLALSSFRFVSGLLYAKAAGTLPILSDQ